MEVGSASFKIAAIGTKMAGQEMKKAAETHGPVIRQNVSDFVANEKINTGKDIEMVRNALADTKNQEMAMKFGERFLEN